MINEIIKRPITPLEEFEIALNKADLSDKDYELIDYIRYTSVFTQPSLAIDLKRSSKPPLLTNICQILLRMI